MITIMIFRWFFELISETRIITCGVLAFLENKGKIVKIVFCFPGTTWFSYLKRMFFCFSLKSDRKQEEPQSNRFIAHYILYNFFPFNSRTDKDHKKYHFSLQQLRRNEHNKGFW